MNAIDFMKADPSTLSASVGLNGWLAEKWMEWPRSQKHKGWQYGEEEYEVWLDGQWKPSTNPAHAGEARRKAGWSRVYHLPGKCIAHINSSGGLHRAMVLYTDVTGDTEEEIKAKAEALAICRAVVAERQAAEKAKEGNNGT